MFPVGEIMKCSDIVGILFKSNNYIIVIMVVRGIFDFLVTDLKYKI